MTIEEQLAKLAADLKEDKLSNKSEFKLLAIAKDTLKLHNLMLKQAEVLAELYAAIYYELNKKGGIQYLLEPKKRWVITTGR